MGSEQEKGSIEHATKAPEAEHEDSIILEEAMSETSSSSSRSSMELDIDRDSDVNDSNGQSICDGDSKILEEAKTRELPSASPLTSSSSSRASLELEADRNSHLNDSIAKSKSDGDLSSRGQESIPTPARTAEWSMSSASPAVGLEGELSQTASPPVQTMESSCSGYDPDRIPASVFSSKTTNEWSTASNESLFSIHMGNNSMARDQFPRLDSLYVLEAKSHELCSLPPLMEVPSNEECSVKSSNVSSLEKDDDPMDTPKATPGATNRLSNESEQSTSSFAFPVLVSGGGNGSSLGQVEERSEVQTQDSAADQKSWCSWCCLPRCC